MNVFAVTDKDIVISGAHSLGGETLVKNIGMCLAGIEEATGQSCGVHLIHFDMFKPKGVFGNCAPDCGAITISLMHTFHEVYDKIVDAEEGGGVRDVMMHALFWHNIFNTLVHEVLHLINPERPDEEIVAQAEILLYAIVRDYNIEPGKTEFMTQQLNELCLGSIEELFLENRQMYEEGVYFWHKPNKETNELKLKTFRAYMHAMSGAEPEDEKWTKPAKNIATKVIDVMPKTSIPMSMSITGLSVEKKTNIPVAAALTTIITPEEASQLATAHTPEEITRAITMATAVSAGQPTAGYEDFVDDDFGTMGETDTSFMDGGYEDFMEGDSMIAYAQTSINQAMPIMMQPVPAQMIPAQPVPAPVHGNAVVTMLADQRTPERKTLPPTGLTAEQTRDIMFGIYSRIYHKIFNECGQLINSDNAFSQAHLVATQPIGLTELEKTVVHEFHCFDENNRWVRVPTTNGLRGYVGKNTGLPMYKIFINVNGEEMCRLIVPQNPGKVNNGEYTKTAAMARSGIKILYIMEGNDRAKAEGAKHYLFKAVVEPGQPLSGWVVC